MNKSALIFGAGGQDGYYLTNLLLREGYSVVGATSKYSPHNQHLFNPYFKYKTQYRIAECSLTDYHGVNKLVESFNPSEVYNFAAQSHVGDSFTDVEYTRILNVDSLSNLIRVCSGRKLLNVSSAEIYGDQYPDQLITEKSTPSPISPYGQTKLEGHELICQSRDKGNFHINTIAFNHESVFRRSNFLTSKILSYFTLFLSTAENRPLELGDCSPVRDWGYAPDFVRGMWMALQHITPEDFILSTGEGHTVEEYVRNLFFSVNINPHLFIKYKKSDRPAGAKYLCGDPSKAKKILGWTPTVNFTDLAPRIINDWKKTSFSQR